MSVRSVFVMAVPAVLVAAVAVAAGAHASAAAPQAVALSGGAVSAGATVMSPGASTASGASAVASLTGEENWSQLCARVGKAMAKAGAADTRLHAGADTRGSLARLRARLDAATTAGDADRVRVLTDLTAMRTAHAQTVTLRLAKLGDIQQVCRTHTR